jgi:hypothetical protein
MGRAVDGFRIVDGVVRVSGWTSGWAPRLLLDGKPLRALVEVVARQDLVALFGPRAARWGFRLVAPVAAPDLRPERLAVRFSRRDVACLTEAVDEGRVLRTVSVRDGAPLSDVDGALRRARGYVRCGGPALPTQSLPLLAWGGMPEPDDIDAVNGRAYEIPSVGCRILGGASVFGPGHVLDQGALVVEGNALDDVPVTWAHAAYPGLGQRRRRRIDETCIAFAGPGHRIYGHWLVDFLPRLHVARLTLGDRFADTALLWPADTPDWAGELVTLLFGPCRRIAYDPEAEILDCGRLVVPTYPLSCDHHFHPCVQNLYRPLRTTKPGWRRLCISRSRIEGRTSGARKVFPQRAAFEEAARRYGFEIVHPEEMPLREQVRLFNQAAVIVGEFGSGLHASVFAPEGTVVAAIGCFNTIQSRLCALYGQRCAYLLPRDVRVEPGTVSFSCELPEIERFLQALRDGEA